MKIKLIKLAQELNTSITDVVEFLTSHGYDYPENAATLIDDNAADFVRNNMVVSAKEEHTQEYVVKETPQQKLLNSKDTPIELKIIEAASGQSKFIERIVGYTEYKWKFNVYHFLGYCSKPVPFDSFDEVLCGILGYGPLQFNKIATLLGLDYTDEAESSILYDAIKSLMEDDVINFSDKEYSLTQKGMEYVKKGAKLSVFQRNFDLYVDPVAGIKQDANTIFSSLRTEKLGTNIKGECDLSLEQIRDLAEIQAPEIHYPKNDFILQNCELKSISPKQASVWVVLLENFRDRTLRTLVYSEETNCIIPILSRELDKNEDIKKQLLEKMIAESSNMDFQMKFTDESKSIDQIKEEEVLISQQVAYDAAVKDNDTKLANTIKQKSTTIKRHFGSLEFEVELKKLFDNTCGELWIISPWIRYVTHRRIPYFEQYMKKGGRVFVAYSEPEKPEDEMAAPQQLAELKELEKKYTNFYLFQLPPFHYKYVFLREERQNLFYTGSYNILSYFAEPNKVRNENMTKEDWTDEIQTIYVDIMKPFARKYIEMEFENLHNLLIAPNKLSISYIKMIENLPFDKIKPFDKQGDNDIDKLYEQLLNEQTSSVQNLLNQYKEEEIKALKIEIGKLDNSLASIKIRKEIDERIKALSETFPEITNSEDYKTLINSMKKSTTIKFGGAVRFKR